jgi:hypothetical protein
MSTPFVAGVAAAAALTDDPTADANADDRDSDGVPVGQADLEADIERSGADPEEA